MCTGVCVCLCGVCARVRTCTMQSCGHVITSDTMARHRSSNKLSIIARQSDRLTIGGCSRDQLFQDVEIPIPRYNPLLCSRVMHLSHQRNRIFPPQKEEAFRISHAQRAPGHASEIQEANVNSIFGFLRSGLAILFRKPTGSSQDIKEEAVCIHAIQIIAGFKSSVISSSPYMGECGL